MSNGHKSNNRTITRASGVLVVVMFFFIIAMQLQLQRLNSQLDNIEEASTDAKAAADKASNDLADAIEASSQGAEDTQAAVQLIFSIFDVLCEQSPRAEACLARNRTGPGG